MIVTAELPTGLYDFIASLPSGNTEALQQEVRKKFGVIGRVETREMDVLLLQVKTPGAQGFKTPSLKRGEVSSNNTAAGLYKSGNLPVSNLAHFLESYLEIPVVDRTGLTGRYDIELRWAGGNDWKKRDKEAVKPVLADQLGLELVPAREPLEMLIVEKSK
jgi:uncharacterized protein (TIGR03435 family)